MKYNTRDFIIRNIQYVYIINKLYTIRYIKHIKIDAIVPFYKEQQWSETIKWLWFIITLINQTKWMLEKKH